MQYLDFARYGSQQESPSLAPFNYGQKPFYNICSDSVSKGALKAYEQYKSQEQMLLNDNPTKVTTLERAHRNDYDLEPRYITVINEKQEFNRVQQLELQVYMLKQKMKQDKDFFLLIFVIIIVAVIITYRPQYQSHVHSSQSVQNNP